MTYGHSEVPKTTRAAELMSPDERVLRARVAAHALHAQHDSRRLTAPARRAFLDRFEREVDRVDC